MFDPGDPAILSAANAFNRTRWESVELDGRLSRMRQTSTIALFLYTNRRIY